MSDLISRADLFNELATVKASPEANEYKAEVYGVIQNLPSAEAVHTDCTDFVNWLLEEVMDEEMWELNAVANGEVIARKLKKLGLLEVKDGYYVRTPSADRPQGKWYQIKDHKVMGEGYMWHCSLCDHRVYQDSSADYPTENFCPYCGARMRGADDERKDIQSTDE